MRLFSIQWTIYHMVYIYIHNASFFLCWLRSVVIWVILWYIFGWKFTYMCTEFEMIMCSLSTWNQRCFSLRLIWSFQKHTKVPELNYLWMHPTPSKNFPNAIFFIECNPVGLSHSKILQNSLIIYAPYL